MYEHFLLVHKKCTSNQLLVHFFFWSFFGARDKSERPALRMAAGCALPSFTVRAIWSQPIPVRDSARWVGSTPPQPRPRPPPAPEALGDRRSSTYERSSEGVRSPPLLYDLLFLGRWPSVPSPPPPPPPGPPPAPEALGEGRLRTVLRFLDF